MSERLLLIDRDERHAERLTARLRSCGRDVEICTEHRRAITELRRYGDEYEGVIVDISDAVTPWFAMLQKLLEACRRLDGRPSPQFLCVSRTKKAPEFVLRLERMGARYVCEG